MGIRAGLIGFGLAGRYFHAPLLAVARINLRAVVTSRATEVHEAYADATVLKSVDELLARDDIDLVVVASPSQFHFAQARDALLARKHVVVDKPLSVTSQEAAELAELARAQGRKLTVFQNRRWDSDLLTIRKLLRESRLGDVAYFRARWGRYRPQIADRWRERAEPGSGMLFDLGSHLIDQAVLLFGKPDWILADVFGQRTGALTDDGFEILMGKGALRISLGVSSLATAGDWRYCIHGSDGSFFKSGLDPQEDQVRSGMRYDDPMVGVEPEALWGRFVAGSGAVTVIQSERGCWWRFYEGVRDCIENDGPVPVSADEVRFTLQIIEAARRSSAEGKRVVL